MPSKEFSDLNPYEVVSPTYRKEYTTKLDTYQALGVLYYIIYSSRRRRKPHLEVHKLVNGKYELQSGHPVWMPEIGLGIGCERGNYSVWGDKGVVVLV